MSLRLARRARIAQSTIKIHFTPFEFVINLSCHSLEQDPHLQRVDWWHEGISRQDRRYGSIVGGKAHDGKGLQGDDRDLRGQQFEGAEGAVLL